MFKNGLMKYIRGILAGIFVWLCVSISFYLLGNILILKDSFLLQAAIVIILIFFYAFAAAKFYYKKKYDTNGLVLGTLMSGTALVLDIFITVPFVEIPNGRTYQSFFSSPVLWLLVFTNIMTAYFYWKKKVIKSPKIHF